MKKIKLLLCLSLIGSSFISFSQGVGINSTGGQPHASAVLDVSADDKGLLIPRLTTAQRDAIVSPAVGLQIFNTDSNCFNFWDGSTWRKSCYECDFNTPAVSNSGPICEGINLNLYASSLPGATYQWTGPNGFTSSSQNPVISNASSAAGGVYSLLVTLNNCTANAVTTTATVYAPPQTPVANSNGPVCVGSTLNLTANNIVGATYSWSGPDGFFSALQNPSLTNVQIAAAGEYNVVATVNGCVSAQGSEDVTIYSNPSAPTAGSNSIVCVGNTLNLTASSQPGASYSWTGPNGFTSATQNPSISNVSVAADGVYSVVLTDTNGCSSAPANTTVDINSVIPSSPVAGSNSPVCQNATLNLTASTISGASYSWSGPNSFSSGSQNPSISNVQTNGAGSYAVTATVDGCTSAPGTISVTVNSAASGSTTFDYGGSIVTWSVPGCINSINIEAWGAQGGNSGAQAGGKGARMKGDFAVSPAQQLKILVGQQGAAATNGNDQGGGTGGGGSYVALSDNTPLIVAGGGGGAGYTSSFLIPGGDATTSQSGVAGGGATGGAGGTSGNGGYYFPWTGWHGGTGGAGFYGNGVGTSNGSGSFGTAMTSGLSFVNGGNGGTGGSGGRAGGFGGGGASGFTGGGGGGYSGGGGGDFQGTVPYSGGGGGSYNNGANQSNSAGIKTGNGQVIITW